jgi:hypothetical protein
MEGWRDGVVEKWSNGVMEWWSGGVVEGMGGWSGEVVEYYQCSAFTLV